MINVQTKYYRSLFLILSFGLFFSGPYLKAQNNNITADQKQPVSVLDSPADFTGWTGYEIDTSALQVVKIGLFMPEEDNEQIINAANLAKSEINNSERFKGIHIKLVQRWATDPWGAGSREMINLIYRDSVRAIIGSLDGETTHIAEQIVTKAWVPLLSPLSADPTLNYINIPWIFRLPPDFYTQSETILKDGIMKHNLQRIGLITSSNHDGRIFAEDLLDVFTRNNYNPIFHFEVPVTNFKSGEIISRIRQFDPQGIIVNLPPDQIGEFLSAFTETGSSPTLFIPWIPGFEADKFAQDYNNNLYFIEPFPDTGNKAYTSFKDLYSRKFGNIPAAGAAYMYDAVFILAEALVAGGLSRTGLRDTIAHNVDMNGVTGKIAWDNGGGNQGAPVLRSRK